MISGQAIEEAGHYWVGCDISKSMLNVAAESELTLLPLIYSLTHIQHTYIHIYIKETAIRAIWWRQIWARGCHSAPALSMESYQYPRYSGTICTCIHIRKRTYVNIPPTCTYTNFSTNTQYTYIHACIHTYIYT